MATNRKSGLASILSGRAPASAPVPVAATTPMAKKTSLRDQGIGVARAAEKDTPVEQQQRVAERQADWTMEDLLRMSQSGQMDPLEAGFRSLELQNKRNTASTNAAAEQRSLEEAALAGLSPEERAAYQTDKQRNTQYGSDLSFLDPSFQMDPALLGQSAGSQVQADQGAIDAQRSLLGQQQALGSRDLQFMGGQQQQAMMDRMLGVQAPQFSGDADQRNVLNQALGFSSNTGPGSLAFDTSGRQGEQYGNLRDIIAGGGATAIEMADRQRQRGDSEAWLRGQREADMADYAERGLTGSGMEMLALNTDRQAAAGRNSLADLETAKALEERRLGAINSAAGLATNMRGQTIDEQSLLNQRATTGLGAAANVANSMRGADYNEKTFLNESARQQALDAADIAGRMRDQTADEQVANRNAQQTAMQQAGSLANQMRTSSFDEGASRASAADNFSVLNNAATNAAKNANTQFMQNSWQQMQNNRQAWDMNQAATNANAASAKYAADQAANSQGYAQALQLALNNSGNFNDAQKQYLASILGVSGSANAAVLGAQQGQNAATAQAGQATGGAIDSLLSMWTGAMGNGGATGAPAANSGQFGASAGGAGAGAAAGSYSGDILDPWKKSTQRSSFQPSNTGIAGYSGY